MIIDDSRNVLAHLKAELHEESAVKASAAVSYAAIPISVAPKRLSPDTQL